MWKFLKLLTAVELQQHVTQLLVNIFQSLNPCHSNNNCIHKLQYYRVQAKKNSKTFKDLEPQIQGRSRTNPVFKYFQGLEFGEKNTTFKDAW